YLRGDRVQQHRPRRRGQEYADRSRAHGDDRIRRQLAPATLAVPGAGDEAAGASRRADPRAVRSGERFGPAGEGTGDSELWTAARRPVFQETAVFLLRAAEAAAARIAADAGGVRDRSEPAGGREHDHVVLHVLRCRHAPRRGGWG